MKPDIDTSLQRAVVYATALAAHLEVPITTQLLLYGVVRQQSEWKSGLVGRLQLHPRLIAELFDDLLLPSADIRFTLQMAAFERSRPASPGMPAVSLSADQCLLNVVQERLEVVTSDDLLIFLASQLGAPKASSAWPTFEALKHLNAAATFDDKSLTRRAYGLKVLMRRPPVGQRRVPYHGCFDDRLQSTFALAWQTVVAEGRSTLEISDIIPLIFHTGTTNVGPVCSGESRCRALATWSCTDVPLALRVGPYWMSAPCYDAFCWAIEIGTAIGAIMVTPEILRAALTACLAHCQSTDVVVVTNREEQCTALRQGISHTEAELDFMRFAVIPGWIMANYLFGWRTHFILKEFLLHCLGRGSIRELSVT